MVGACAPPAPAFPSPDYSKHRPILLEVLQKVQNEIDSIVAERTYDTTAFSIEVTSSKGSLWSSFHRARERDPLRPGAEEVDGNSVYRIASITKTFTILGVLKQHTAGHLNLDDAIDTYLTDLKGAQSGSIRWKDITLRSLASQLSGLPFDWPKSGLPARFHDPTKLGLPPPNNSASLPQCDQSNEEEKPCSGADLIMVAKSLMPLFAPNARSTYSNIAFELLGLVLSKVSGMSYEEYIATSILNPLGMNATTFVTPPDPVAVLPKNQSWYFSVDQGVHNPTGGLYSTSSDLSLYLRYILSHYNDLAPGINWLQPASFATGPSTYYGMPWEIYRTPTPNPVTFYTKGGEVPGYASIIALAPEYDLGITILVGGNAKLLSRLLKAVSIPLVEAAREIAGLEVRERYTGTYAATDLNSTLTLAYTPDKGLYIERWISNGTDFLAVVLQKFLGAMDDGTRLQIVPTMLCMDEEKQKGERWRAVPVEADQGETKGVWDDFCITHMYDYTYDGEPLNEVVFWDGEVELTGLKIRLRKIHAMKEEVREGTGSAAVLKLTSPTWTWSRVIDCVLKLQTFVPGLAGMKTHQ
ncbi:hypothetical protein OHC33_000998 [Knufia fluminis]|uniref:Beta-lactamase-related domain-containing protein n=1 Tax=Knufia fluminis TaxID=191047 RepID=A0AAN8EKE1_9EURO|nr:hypothetical protein OHC33_000998 [Knufia fluminis]